MRVLMLNVFENKGSTGQLVASLSSYLESRGHEVISCYRDGSPSDGKKKYRIGRKIETALTYRYNYVVGFPYGGAYFSTLRLLRVLKKEKVDVVSIHSINASYINIYWLLQALKRWNIPVVMTHHSEYLYTGNCTHAMDCNQWKTGCRECAKRREYHLSYVWDSSSVSYKRMKRAFAGIRNCTAVAVSDWVLNRAKQSSIMENIPHLTIENGIDESIFYPRKTEHLKEAYGINDEKVVFFSTACFTDRENDIKGGKYVIELAKYLKAKNVRVLVAALSVEVEKEYENLQFVGSITEPQKLAELYSLANVVVIASKRETFSMPTAEALMCGTAVAGFYAGGPETIAISQYSRFCEYGDIDALCANVMELIECTYNRERIAEAARKRYSKEVMCWKYSEIIESAARAR